MNKPLENKSDAPEEMIINFRKAKISNTSGGACVEVGVIAGDNKSA